MSAELIDCPAVTGPERTDPADSRRLARALDAHGVPGAVARICRERLAGKAVDVVCCSCGWRELVFPNP